MSKSGTFSIPHTVNKSAPSRHRRVHPNKVPMGTSSSSSSRFSSPVRDLQATDTLVGLPEVRPDGSTRLTPLPKPPAFESEQRAKLLKTAFERPLLKREITGTQEEEELEVTLDEGDTLTEDGQGNVVMQEDEEVVEENGGGYTPLPANKKKKRTASDGKPLRKKRKKEQSDEEEEEEEKKAEEELPEGFAGLKGWQAIGGVTDLMSKLQNGEINNGAWVQYTRAASTFIPSTRYKKLQEEAKHKGRDLADLVEEEKKAMLSKGRKKTLCMVTLGTGEQEGAVLMSSIPPKGGRGSNFYPYQQRSWQLKADTDGDIVVYLKSF
jgi:hypothetical protein